MKEQDPEHEHIMREHKDEEEISALSEQLAPLEEKTRKTESGSRYREDDRALVLDTGKLVLPKGLVDGEQERRGILGLDPVILVILTMLIAFIVAITYLVYKMPAPVK